MSYSFNQLGSITSDSADASQRNVQNIKFGNYQISNFFSGDARDADHLDFALNNRSILVNGVNGGVGLNGGVVDIDSQLTVHQESERPLEKLQLNQRLFSTVPYLGRGSCDPALESYLLQGDLSSDKKSVSTIMEQSFMGYTLYPTDSQMEEQVNNSKYTVEESAMHGWVRGGASTREMSADQIFSKNNRPVDTSY
jgi:hypothetical protein